MCNGWWTMCVGRKLPVRLFACEEGGQLGVKCGFSLHAPLEEDIQNIIICIDFNTQKLLVSTRALSSITSFYKYQSLFLPTAFPLLRKHKKYLLSDISKHDCVLLIIAIIGFTWVGTHKKERNPVIIFCTEFNTQLIHKSSRVYIKALFLQVFEKKNPVGGGTQGGPAKCRLQLFCPFSLHLQPDFKEKSTSTKNCENQQSTINENFNFEQFLDF